jgi:AraC-like DNA-binding protein
MNTVERLNAVVDYIEKNITEKLDLNHLAGIACYSLHDFQRMFTFIAEMSITEYIRKRRLTLAGLDLQQNNAKVMDTALKYDYESPVSFARAFQAFHGFNPGEAIQSDVVLKIFPRLIFQIIVKEVSQMIRTDKITVNGKEYEASYFGEQDLTHLNLPSTKREFWRLENAYGDFKDNQITGEVLPYNNYPMNIETEQVFAIDYTRKDGFVERCYYLSDGTVWQDMPSTTRFWPEAVKAARIDIITVSGKEYEASYFGEQDVTHLNLAFVKRRFWRLENAYDDFKDKQGANDVLPYNNYPMNIETEQVFVIDYTKRDGSVERCYYFSDGTIWHDMPSTRRFWIEEK